ncbi:MAG TPA: GIY-YIG nuclease family protein [Clostridiaceae bacterium]
MGLMKSLLKVIAGYKALTVSSLKEASENAPNLMGCYKVFLNGELKYVGKSEYSLKQRFAQYYGGRMIYSAAAKKIHENRENIEVSWVVQRSDEDCKRLEEQWIAKLSPEWNKI